MTTPRDVLVHQNVQLRKKRRRKKKKRRRRTMILLRFQGDH